MERLSRLVRTAKAALWALTADGHSESLEVSDQFQVTFPILLDRRGRVRDAYGITRLPAFVHIGSVGIYGQEGQGQVTETTAEEPRPDLRGIYTATKLRGDHALLEEAAVAGGEDLPGLDRRVRLLRRDR